VSLRDAVVERAGAAIDDRAPGWLAAGLEHARGALADRHAQLDQEQPGLGDSGHARELERQTLDHAATALDAIERRSPALLELGRARASMVLVQLASGRKGEARRLALAGDGATLQDRRAESGASTSATRARTAAREKATDEALELLEEVGQVALRCALPFLLAAL